VPVVVKLPPAVVPIDRPVPAVTLVTVPVLDVYAVVSKVHVFAAVFFNKPVVPVNASIALRSSALVMLLRGIEPVAIVPSVVIAVLPVHVESFVFSTLPRPTSLLDNVVQLGI
jgi:hypothetical protein